MLLVFDSALQRPTDRASESIKQSACPGKKTHRIMINLLPEAFVGSGRMFYDSRMRNYSVSARTHGQPPQCTHGRRYCFTKSSEPG